MQKIKKKMSKYYLSIYIGAIFTVVAQLLLKKGALSKKKNNVILNLLNQYVVLGYVFFVIVTLLNLFAFKEVPLIIMIVISAVVQIFVVIFSVIIFKEKVNKKQILGIAIIILGVILFNL